MNSKLSRLYGALESKMAKKNSCRLSQMIVQGVVLVGENSLVCTKMFDERFLVL